jgi:hypothetical protein
MCCKVGKLRLKERNLDCVTEVFQSEDYQQSKANESKKNEKIKNE